MARLPRPLLGLLVATVAFFAIWTVALKPSGSSHGSAPAPAAPPATPSHAAAKPAAVPASHAAPAHSHSAPPASHSAPAASHSAPAASRPAPAASRPATQSNPAVARTPAPAKRANVVENALAQHKALAVLFYNPAAADDDAVKRELAAVPNHGGRVVKLAVPLTELTRYPVITSQLQVTESPTLVLIDSSRKADMLTGFIDQFEIAQRVDDTLAAK